MADSELNRVRAATEQTIQSALDRLKEARAADNKLFPNGIDLIDVQVETETVRIHLKLAGPGSAQDS